MMLKRPLIAVFLLIAGFAAGRATPRGAAPPVAIPIAESARGDASKQERALGACKNELVNAKAQLAICLAFRASPESCAPTPTAEMDDETARLVRGRTTNTDVLLVQLETGGMRAYLPGRWPPPGGPPPNSRVVARKVEGGIEWYRDGGATELVPVPDRPMLCPCPRDTLDAGEGAP
jgi:hypothetical protein